MDQDFIALGGISPLTFGDPAPLLKTFSLSSEFNRTYSHGQNPDADYDLDVVAQSSSSKSDDILVNYHHSGRRVTLIKDDLLKDVVEARIIDALEYFS